MIVLKFNIDGFSLLCFTKPSLKRIMKTSYSRYALKSNCLDKY